MSDNGQRIDLQIQGAARNLPLVSLAPAARFLKRGLRGARGELHRGLAERIPG